MLSSPKQTNQKPLTRATDYKIASSTATVVLDTNVMFNLEPTCVEFFCHRDDDGLAETGPENEKRGQRDVLKKSLGVPWRVWKATT